MHSTQATQAHHHQPVHRRATVWLAAMAAAGAIANPQNPQVITGQASFQANGKQLTITNTPGAVIHWQSFGIDRGELTRFVQQNAASAVLNRITGTDPSRILGALQSNGRVFIINPNGIVFGAGAQVDVAGLVVSSLKLSDQDFLAGRLRFGDTPGAGEVRNEGRIRTPAGGQVVLVAPRVENSGLIEAPNGVILLAAGRSVEVSDIDRPSIRVEISNSSEEAVNIGTLIGRNISIYGGLVRNSGTIQASSAVVGENGKVTLRGKQAVVLAPTSVVEAKGPSGGEVLVQSDGNTVVQGSISVRAELPVAPLVPTLPSVVEPATPIPSALATTQPLPAMARSVQSPAQAAMHVAVETVTTSPAPAAVAAELPAAPPGGGFPAAAGQLPRLAADGAAPAGTPTVRPLATAPADPLIPPRPAPQAPTQPLAPGPAAPVAPASGNGVGGSIRVLGRSVTIGDNAVLDASGPLGGGEILVGGGWQGLNPNIINSQITYIAATAQLFSTAELRGNGGLVVVWADDTARIYGRIAARGGLLGGNGGAIETSGKRMLEVTQVADASAPRGKGGMWLLDPTNITISSAADNLIADTDASANFNYEPTGTPSRIAVATIVAALEAGVNVTVTTSGNNGELGDITISNAIVKAAGANATLTLSAHNTININADISSTVGALNLVLVPNSDNASGGSALMNSGRIINLNGGTLTLAGNGDFTLSASSVFQNLAFVKSGTGTYLAPNSLTLNGVTVGTNMAFGNTLNIQNDLLLANGVTVDKGANNWNFVTTGARTLGLAAGATSAVVSSTGGSITAGVGVGGQALSIGAGVTLQSAGAGALTLTGINSATITNNGTIASTTGGSWTINPTTFTNNGAVTASNGTVNISATSWSNAGTGVFNVGPSGTLNLSSTFTNANVGAFNRTGGSVNITSSGIFNLGGSTLDVGSVGLFGTGGLTQLSGTLLGGTLISTDATPALASSSGTLDGMTIGASLSVNGTLNIRNDLLLANGVTVDKGANNWNFVTTGARTLGLAAGATSAVVSSTGGSITAGVGVGGQALSIGAGVTLQSAGAGALTLTGINSATITNNGTIASTTGGSWTINPTTFTNNGAVTASNGTVNISATSWSNAGTGVFNVGPSGTLNLSSTFTNANVGAFNRTGGSVNITSSGIFNLGGSTLDVGSAGLFGTGGLTQLSGTLLGGTLISTDATPALASSSGTLDGMTIGASLSVNGTLNIRNDLLLANGVTVDKGANNWNFVTTGARTLGLAAGATSAVVSSTGGSITAGVGVGGQALSIGAGVTLQSAGAGALTLTGINSATITNNGTIASTTGGSWTINPTTFTNNGAVTASNGTVNISATSWSNAGTGVFNVGPSGTLNLSSTFTNANVGAFNRTGGSVNITSSGIFNLGGSTLDVGSAGLFGTGGLTQLSGTLLGGTLISTDATPALASSSGTLDGMTIGASLSVNGTLNIRNDLLLANGVTVDKGANNWNFVTTGARTLGLAAGATSAVVSSTGGSITAGVGVGGQALSIGAGVTLQSAGAGALTLTGINSATITNNGTIASTTGGSWTINPTTFTNNGAVTASNGTVNISATSWSNAGTGVFNVGPSGTLNLSSTFTNANVGAFNRTGGSVNITSSGIFNLGGSTLDVGSAGLFGTGGLTQLSGTLLGGTLISTDATPALASSSGTLDGMTIGASLSVNGTLNIRNDLLLANGVTVDKGANNWNFVTTGARTLGLAAGATSAIVSSTGGSITAGVGVGGQALSIGAGVTLQSAGAGALTLTGINSATITNNGTIASTTGGSWTINPTTFTNNGAVTASNGTVNISATSWSNAGTGVFNVGPSGTLNLSSTFTNANVGAFNRTGGSVNITSSGIFNLGGSTLDVGSAGLFGTGGLTQLSGTLLGGTLISTDATPALASSSGTLDGMTIGASLSVNGTLNIRNDLLLANGVTVDKGANNWNFVTTGARTLGLAAGATSAVVSSTGGSITAGVGVGGQALSIGAGVTLQSAGAGALTLTGINSATITNNGTIASTTGGSWTINPTTFTNNGAVTASNGTVNISATSWSNAGTGVFNVGPSGTLNLSSTFTNANVGAFNRTGGSVNITSSGIFNLGGSTLDVGSAGLFGTGGLTQLSGTLLGGTLISTDATPALASSSGTLDGMTIGASLSVNGTLNIRNDLLLANGVTVDKGANNWNFVTTGARTLGLAAGATSAIVSSTGGSITAGVGVGGQALSIGTGVTLQSAGAGALTLTGINSATITNNGTIASTTGGSWTINPTTFTNAAGGTLVIGAGSTLATGNNSFTNSGTILSGGSINMGTGTLTNNGLMKIGASPGFTTVTGNLVLGGTGTLEIEIAGYSRGVVTGYDALHVTGNVTLGGTVNVIHMPGFTANVGDVFHIISAGGTRSGSFATVFPPTGLEPYAQGSDGKNAYIQRGLSFTGVNVWNTDSSGNFNLAANWSAGVVPSGTDIVIIDRGPIANPVVTVNTPITVGRLNATESVLVSGSTLTVNGPAIFGANLDLAAGGTLALNGASSVTGTYTHTSGTLTGTGDLTVLGNAALSAGSLTGTGSLTTTGAVSVGDFTLSRTWNAQGSTSLSGANIVRFINGTINNSGSFSLDGTQTSPLLNNGGSNAFNNTGTLTKTTATSANISVPLNNAVGANLAVNAGSLVINVAGSEAGNTTVASGATLRLQGNRSYGSGTSVSGLGTLDLQSGTISFGAGATLGLASTGTFTFSGATADFSLGPLTLANGLSITGGTLTGSSNLSATTAALTAGTLTGTGSLTTTGAVSVGDFTLSRTWNAQGNTSLSGANIVRFINGTINNSGSFGLDGTQTSPLLNNGGSNAFNNTGTLTKTTATVANISVPLNNAVGANLAVNAGSLVINVAGSEAGNTTVASGATLRLQGNRSYGSATSVSGLGTLDLQSGTVSFGAGATLGLASTGTFTLSGATADFSLGALTLANGLNMASGTLTGSSNITAVNATLTSGSLTGTGSLTTTGAVGVGDITLSRTWNAQGNTSLSGANIVRFINGTINNSGSFGLDGTQTSPLLNNGGNNAFNNTGTLTKTTATVANISVPLNNAVGGNLAVNAGSLVINAAGSEAGNTTVASGATLRLQGNRSYGSGTSVSGLGTLDLQSGTVSFGAGTTLGLASTGTFTLSGATADFSLGALTLANGLNMASGTLTGSSDITAVNATLTSGSLTGTGSLTTTGAVSVGDITLSRTWNAQGNTSLSGANIVRFINGTINNSGSFGLDGTQTSPLLNNGGNNAFNNTGTLTKTTATVANISVPLNNAVGGNLAVNAGSLVINAAGSEAGNTTVASGATLRLQGNRSYGSGASVSGLGTLDLQSGTVSFGAGTTLGLAGTGTFTLSGATADFSLGALTLANGLNMASGTLTGSSNITAVNATLTSGSLTGTGSLTTTGAVGVGDITLSRTWNAQGNTSLSGANIVRFINGTINNSGSFGLDGTQTSPLLNNGGNNAFNNTGTLTKTTATVANISVPLNNAVGGNLAVNAGSLAANGGLSQAGTLGVAAGATLSRPGGFVNSGTITGAGTVDVTGSALTNAGTIQPDGGGADPTGTLTITGNYIQTSAGTLQLQTEGTAAGAFDRLAVSGSAALAGTLAVATASGFVPASGQTFGFVTYANNSGAFSTITAPAFAGLNPTYGATSAVFQVQSGCVVDVCWIGTSGDWSAGANWSTGSAPAAGQNVSINVAGLQTITVSGAAAANQLNADENFVFSAGNLTLGGPSAFTKLTTFSGGTLTANGSTSFAQVALNSGLLAGSGNITVGNSFSQGTGVVNSTGNLAITHAAGNLSLGQITANSILATAQAGSLTVVGALSSPGDITLAAQGASNNLTVGGNITGTGIAGKTLTLRSDNSVVFGSSAGVATTNAMNVVLNADRDASNVGAIILGAGTVIDSKGGNITLGGGASGSGFAVGAGSISPNDRGVDLSGATLSANGGDIVIRGRGFAGSGADNYGVYIHNDSTVQTSGAGTITIVGEGGTGTNSNQGVRIDGNSANGTTISTVDGALSITGTGGTGVGGGSGGFLRGIRFIAGKVSSVNGAITLTGTSGNDAGNDNDGVHMASQATVESTGSGNIQITGTVGGATALVDNDGVSMGGTVRSTGAGTIAITGISNGNGATGQLNTGVYINGTVESTALSGGGSISLAGTAGPGTGGDKGVFIDGGNGLGIVRSQNSAIAITATGGVSAGDYGLLLSGASASLSTVSGGSISVAVTGPAAGSRIQSDRPIDSAGSLSLTTPGSIGLVGLSSNGAMALTSSSAGSDITLNGSLQATNTSLADNAPAINVTSGRDILLGSTSDITANSSGAITLNAAGAVNLKVNDGGGSVANNLISAAGNLAITAGSSIDRTDGNAVSLAGKAIALNAGTSIGPAGGSIVASTGNVTLNAGSAIAVNTLSATAGSIDINGGSTVSATALSAGTSIFVDGAGSLSLGTLTASNGLVNLTATGAGSDVILGGSVTATNTGLPPTQPAISVNAGRDILVASTADLATLTSGGITLLAGRDVNLKVDDGGNNGANSTIAAAGNLHIVATSGQIVKTDGNAVTASGQGIALTSATGLDATLAFAPVGALDITRSSGDLIATSFSGPVLNLHAPGGNVVFAAGSTFSGGTVTASGAGSAAFNAGVVTFTSSLASALPLTIGGAGVNFNAVNAAVSAPALTMSSGSATFAVAPALPDLTLAGGTVTINGGAAQVISTGTWNIGAGSVLNLPAPGASVAALGTLNVNGGSVIYGATLSVAGNLGLSSGSLAGTGPVTVDATGTVTKTGAGSFTVTNTLNNNGTVNALAGTLALSGGGTHAGTFTAASGSTLDFQAGTHNFSDGAVFSGAGTFDGGGTLNLAGSTTGLRFAADTVVNLNALAFSGSGTLTNQGTTSGSALSLPGDFINAAGGTANLTNVTIAGSLYNHGNFNTGGTVTVAGLQGQQLGGVLSIPKDALLDMANPSGVFNWQDGTIGGAGTLGFSGGGTYLFDGTGDRVINGLNFAFKDLKPAGGSLTILSGSVTLTGAAVLPAGVKLKLVGGTLTNNGTLEVGGEFSLTGGAFGGSGSLNLTGGKLSLQPGNSVIWTSSGTLTNTGTLNLASSTITNAIDNQGTINLGGGLTFTQQLTNTGTVDAQAGNAVFSGGLVQNAGGDIVLTGGTLQGNLALNAGSIRGTGTVNGSVTVGSATMAPGFSPGALDITGDLNLGASSVLNIELGGLARGTGYDWINVQGTARLAGTLNVSQVGGFMAPAGSNFSILSFASATGAFASVNLPVTPAMVLTSLPTGLSASVPAPVFTPEVLLVADPISIASERILPMEELIAQFSVIAPAAQTEPEREIEVEGCR